MGEREIPLDVLLRYFRVPTGDVAVDYPGREIMLGSAITNLSVSGVFIRTQKPLALGTELLISFRLPGTDALIRTAAVVRWCTPPEMARRAGVEAMGMGLEFMNMARRDQKAIERFVRDFLLKMRKK